MARKPTHFRSHKCRQRRNHHGCWLGECHFHFFLSRKQDDMTVLPLKASGKIELNEGMTTLLDSSATDADDRPNSADRSVEDGDADILAEQDFSKEEGGGGDGYGDRCIDQRVAQENSYAVAPVEPSEVLAPPGDESLLDGGRREIAKPGCLVPVVRRVEPQDDNTIPVVDPVATQR